MNDGLREQCQENTIGGESCFSLDSLDLSAFSRNRSLGFNYDYIPNTEFRNLNFGLQPLASRRRKFDYIVVYKIIFGPSRLKPNTLFTFRNSTARGCFAD